MAYTEPAWEGLDLTEMITKKGQMPPPPQWDIDQLQYEEFKKLFIDEGLRAERSKERSKETMAPPARVQMESRRRLLFNNDCKRILKELKDPEFWEEWIWKLSQKPLLAFIERVKQKGPAGGYLLLLQAAYNDPNFKGRRMDYHSLPGWAKQLWSSKSQWEAAIRNAQ